MTRDQSASYIKAIHVAKRDTGLDDEAYRALLQGAAGVSSTKEITSIDGFRQVLKAFDAFGRKPRKEHPGLYAQSWACTPRQQSIILALWLEVGNHQDEQALTAFIKRIAKVDSPRFLTTPRATDVIVALRRMQDELQKKAIRKDQA
jgi:hypothetical protein